MVTDNIDHLLLEVNNGPTNNDLKTIQALAQRQIDIEDAISDMEEKIRQLSQSHREISERLIPDVLTAIGVEEYVLLTGEKISIKEIVEASIVKATEKDSLQWLREQGFGDIIKNEIKVPFAKEQDALAQQAKKYLEDLGLEIEQKEGVHAGTFKSFAKEQLQEGLQFPPELFSIWQGRKSKITRPKQK